MEQPQTDLFSSELSFDDTAKAHISSMASWAMVIVAVAVIGYALSVLAMLTSGTSVAVRREGFGSSFLSNTSSPGQVMFNICIGMLINYFLFSFARGSKRALNSTSQAQMADSFRNLKIYFIITSVILLLFAIVLFFVLTAVL